MKKMCMAYLDWADTALLGLLLFTWSIFTSHYLNKRSLVLWGKNIPDATATRYSLILLGAAVGLSHIAVCAV